MSKIYVDNILSEGSGNQTRVNDILISENITNEDNRVINGTFDIWQRGTSFSANSSTHPDGFLHTADMVNFYFNASDTGEFQVSRQDFLPGEKLGDNSPKHYLRVSTSGQSDPVVGGAFIGLLLDDVRLYTNETISILGWAKKAGGTGNNLSISIRQDFGDSNNATVDTAGGLIALENSWEPFSVTVNVPTIANTQDFESIYNYKPFVILIIPSLGSSYDYGSNVGLQDIDVDLWGIHVRKGAHDASVANYYSALPYDIELKRCQGYYEKTYPMDVVPGTATLDGAMIGWGHDDSFSTTAYYLHKSKKYGTGSLTAYNPSNGNSGKILVNGSIEDDPSYRNSGRYTGISNNSDIATGDNIYVETHLTIDRTPG